MGGDPDGIAEPLVNALRALEATPGFDPKPTVAITAPTNGGTVIWIGERHRQASETSA